MDSKKDWKRLGRLLVERRTSLVGHANRTRFAADHDLLNDRILSDLEKGRRDNYSPATIALMEHVYEVQPGSFEAALMGGDLTPTDSPSSLVELARRVSAGSPDQPSFERGVVDLAYRMAVEQIEREGPNLRYYATTEDLVVLTLRQLAEAHGVDLGDRDVASLRDVRSRRSGDLGAEWAGLPDDLAARQTGRRGGAEAARTAQDHDGESPDEDR